MNYMHVSCRFITTWFMFVVKPARSGLSWCRFNRFFRLSVGHRGQTALPLNPHRCVCFKSSLNRNSNYPDSRLIVWVVVICICQMPPAVQMSGFSTFLWVLDGRSDKKKTSEFVILGFLNQPWEVYFSKIVVATVLVVCVICKGNQSCNSQWIA